MYPTNMAPNFAHGGGMNRMILYNPMPFFSGPGPSHMPPAVGHRGAAYGPTSLVETWRAPQRPGPSYASVLEKDAGQPGYWDRSPRKLPYHGNVSGAQGSATDFNRNFQYGREAAEFGSRGDIKSRAEVESHVDPRKAEDDEAKRDLTPELTKLMESMLLDVLREPQEDGGTDPCVEGPTPFATMALEMAPVTKDGAVVKKVVQPGWGQPVLPGSGVAFHYEAFLENSNKPFYSTRKQTRPYRCVVEEARIVGLSFAVATMRKGEKAWVLVSPPYGRDQSTPHPTKTDFAQKTVLYKVELLQIIDPQDKLRLHTFVNDGALRRMPFRDVLKLCDISRQRAAAYCKCDQFFQALGCYTDAIQALEEAQTDDPAENAEGNHMLLGLYSNAALCSIKTGKGKLAVMYAERSLRRNPKDANALYRCGVGLKMQSKFDKATQCLFKALKLHPDSVAIAEELRVVGRLKRLQLASAEETAYRPRKFQTASDEQLPCTSGKNSLLPAERQTVSFRMRSHIRDRLERLKVAKPGESLTFTVGFDDAHIDFIRTTCWMMGLQCDLLQDGVIVRAPSSQ